LFLKTFTITAWNTEEWSRWGT